MGVASPLQHPLLRGAGEDHELAGAGGDLERGVGYVGEGMQLT